MLAGLLGFFCKVKYCRDLYKAALDELGDQHWRHAAPVTLNVIIVLFWIKRLTAPDRLDRWEPGKGDSAPEDRFELMPGQSVSLGLRRIEAPLRDRSYKS